MDIDKEGTVLQAPDKSGSVLVQAGIIRSRVKIGNLRLLDKKKVQFNGTNVRTGKGSVKKSINVSGRSASMECDLRGMTVDEALLTLDSFIDNAILTHVHQITIIHGKGTGALRAAVQAHLKQHKAIRTFRLGVYGEGEAGVTVAELK